MVHTVPITRVGEHKSWHTFEKGMCMYCGWYCIDCPEGVTTCKCVAENSEELADTVLKLESTGISDSWYEEPE